VLAAHDSDADRRLDFQEFTSFMNQFMAAAGFHLHEVLEDLITLTQTKVRLCWISSLYCFFFWGWQVSRGWQASTVTAGLPSAPKP
jgi:hypothetical protein